MADRPQDHQPPQHERWFSAVFSQVAGVVLRPSHLGRGERRGPWPQGCHRVLSGMLHRQTLVTQRDACIH